MLLYLADQEEGAPSTTESFNMSQEEDSENIGLLPGPDGPKDNVRLTTEEAIVQTPASSLTKTILFMRNLPRFACLPRLLLHKNGPLGAPRISSCFQKD